MRKYIKSVAIKAEQGELLREKAIELLMKSKQPIKEVDIVNFLINEVTPKVDIDEMGFYLKEEDHA